jgi:transposase
MRKIKDVLRLKWTCNLSHRQVSGALGVGLGTITQYLQLAASAGLDWAKIEPLSEAELEQLFRRRPQASAWSLTAPGFIGSCAAKA